MSLLHPRHLPLSLPKPISKSILFSQPTTISNISIPIKIKKLPSFSSKPTTLTPCSSSSADFTFDYDGGDEEFYEDSPWEGAVIYKRDASITHVEYCTTLERLGLGELSTGVSKSRASAMGMRLVARKREGGDGTPVLVSVDVTRRKRRLKVDGIVRTVLTLACNRCAEPAAKCIFSNFTLLLTEDRIEDPDDEINMGVIYGENNLKSSISSSRTEDEEEDEKEIDPDDKLYFPSEEKEIDISKQIRDIVHLEITIDEICSASCMGLCLKCGINLNKRRCTCSKEEVEDGEYGPLKNLRKQMQQR